MENKDKNEIKYAVIYSMIMDLYEQGSIDKATAEKINSKCAEQLYNGTLGKRRGYSNTW